MLHRGSYISAHVLLNLFNELGKSDKMRGLPIILLLFRNELNKFNNTGGQMFYFIYHMTLKLIKTSHFWRENVKILPSVTQRYNGPYNVPRKSVHHYYRLYCIALYHSQTRRHVIKYLFSVFKIKLELLDSILLLSPAVIFFKSNFA